MLRTLKLSFALKNTCRVNNILYSLKQIPLIKKILPDALYQCEGLKILANIISLIWEILTVFLGKLLYLVLMVFGAGFLYSDKPEELYILHILLFMSIVGSFVNTHLFNPSKDKYYAMILMRMNAREYTLTNYTYNIVKTLVGFLITLPIFGLLAGFPLWLCLILPFCIVGMKLFAASVPLYGYGINGKSYNESRFNMLVWIGIFIFLALAYGLPLARITLPMNLSILLFICCLPLGVAGAVKIYSFKDYLEVNKELLIGLTGQMDKSASTKLIKQQNEKRISTDSSIVSSRKGFEYLNELFIKRHKKILWSSALKIFIVCLFLITGALLAIYFAPEIRPKLNRMVMLSLPYFTFIMYAINRGTNFTQALFMNCDHSLLTYSFYKRRTFVLRLFVIRLREIVKINALPALTIAVGLALILFCSGGTDNWSNYLILILSLLCMSIFFSVHYLTIYYLLQPYNAGTELKSGMYSIIMMLTYLCCFILMQLRITIQIFGLMMIAFSLVYCAVACVLVYKFAPKTFKIRV